jgi:hypothetical protein
MFNLRIVQHGHIPKPRKNTVTDQLVASEPRSLHAASDTDQLVATEPQSQPVASETLSQLVFDLTPPLLPTEDEPHQHVTQQAQEPLLEDLIEIACMSPSAQIQKLNNRSKILLGLIFSFSKIGLLDCWT